MLSSMHAPCVLAWLAFRASGARQGRRPGHIEAVVFDLDGVLVDSEHVWDAARKELAAEQGRPWPEQASRDMMGMSSIEWSRYMHDVVGLPEPPEEISAKVVRRLEEIYRRELPLIDGAVEAVERLAERWPLGLASSSNRELIDLVLELSGLARYFVATVSSEEVPRGKPAPDVYLEATRRLGVAPARCIAIEDSENGIRSAKAAGMRVLAIPNPRYPPTEEALALADEVLRSIDELTPETIERVG
jgi:HAD superfamily hydrolase (TIGR01509 family)